MISTFGTFTVARLGILAASQGLNVTGNNISNINTDNYVRQTLDQFTIHVGGADMLRPKNIASIGNGVITPSVSHDRDIYLDIRYRNANAMVGETDARVNGLDNLSTILDEVTKGDDGDGVMEAMYNDMLSQLNALVTEGAGKDEYDTLFRSAMSAFTHQLNKSAMDLNSLMASTEGQFKQDLDAANAIIDQIRILNTSIRKNQIYGDPSLEQQDQRDGLLDQLSKYIKLEVTYEREEVSRGLEVDKLVIHTGTEPPRLLVDGIYAANLTVRQKSDDDLGVVNALGFPAPYSEDHGAVTGMDGSMDATAQAQTFSRMSAAQSLADALTKEADGLYEYRPVTEESGAITVHQFAPAYNATLEEVDNGAVTDAEGAMVKDEEALAFSSIEEAQALAAELTDASEGAYAYRPVTDEAGVITVHQFSTEYRPLTDESGEPLPPSSSQALMFESEDAAKQWADTMNAEYRSQTDYSDTDKVKEDKNQIKFNSRYQVKGGKYGEPYTVHMYDVNYDLNFTDLVDTHGLTKIVRKIDLGAVKNNDRGAIIDKEGNTSMDPDEPLLTFGNVREAQELAQKLTDSAGGETEYRVLTDDAGVSTIHAFGATIYSKKEDAQAALEEMKADTSEHINVNGEATHYFYDITEQVEGSNTWEIRMFDIFRGRVQLGDQELGGKLLAERELLTEDGYFSTANDLERDPDAAGKRGIPFYIHSLDSMANHMASTLNEANQLPDATIYQTNDRGEFLDAEGNVTEDREKYVLREEYSFYNGGALFSNHPNTNDETYINARNISISKNWDNGSRRVLRSSLPNAPSTANDNLSHMYNLLTKAQTFVPNSEVYKSADNNDIYFSGSYQQLITDHISASLGNDLRTASTMQTNYATDADELYVNRDGVMGVDLNDEAMMIMKYQKAYSAACRLMTSYDQLLERLVGMGA